MTRWGALASLGLLLMVAGCGDRHANRLTIEGQPFSGGAKADRDDRAAFTATGGPVSVSLDGARQAAAFEAVKYCIGYLGSSDIAWSQSPDAPEAELEIENDRVTVSGRCLEP